MRVSLIVACSLDGVIGFGGGLPWRLPADLAHFKRTTMGHAVIMGSRTFAEIRAPLPGRRNIVVTRRAISPHEGVEIAGSVEQALALAESDARETEAFVIGGGQIYRLAMDLVDRMYITRVHTHVEGDTTFPEFDEERFVLVGSRRVEADEANEFAMDFLMYDRAG